MPGTSAGAKKAWRSRKRKLGHGSSSGRGELLALPRATEGSSPASRSMNQRVWTGRYSGVSKNLSKSRRRKRPLVSRRATRSTPGGARINGPVQGPLKVKRVGPAYTPPRRQRKRRR